MADDLTDEVLLEWLNEEWTNTSHFLHNAINGHSGKQWTQAIIARNINKLRVIEAITRRLSLENEQETGTETPVIFRSRRIRTGAHQSSCGSKQVPCLWGMV